MFMLVIVDRGELDHIWVFLSRYARRFPIQVDPEGKTGAVKLPVNVVGLLLMMDHPMGTAVLSKEDGTMVSLTENSEASVIVTQSFSSCLGTAKKNTPLQILI